MADLPEERLDASTDFTNVGVDYFGPFIVKIGRRNEKRWCCLFTCLTMRTMHIEVVPMLDTDSCLNAIMRSIARRGKPSTIISDNGTNFVGAKREFAEFVSAWNKGVIEQHRIQRGISKEVQPTRSTPIWRSMGTVGEKLQESNICSIGEQISHRGRSFNNDVCS